MSVYVDMLMNHGWILRGHKVKSCHMTADTPEELHTMAEKIGMKRSWFQPKSLPHYDLTTSRRKLALENGAIEITKNTFLDHMKRLRACRHLFLALFIILLVGCTTQPVSQEDSKVLSEAMKESVTYSLETGEIVELKTVYLFIKSDRLRKVMAGIWRREGFQGMRFKERAVEVMTVADEMEEQDGI